MTTQAPVALITGAARRIGAAITHYLHTAGFRVVIHYFQSESAAHSLAQNLNLQQKDTALTLKADIRQELQITTLLAATLTWGKRLDLLVNNASIFIKDVEVNAKQWDNLFTTNVQAPYRLSQGAFPHLAQQHGSIINITDTHVDKPLKNYGIYCQTKAALTMQTRSLSREFAPHVRVNAVAPGAIAWPENNNELPPEIKDNIINKTPLQRHGKPEDIAKAVIALAENTFITGQVLCVDGGRSLI